MLLLRAYVINLRSNATSVNENFSERERREEEEEEHKRREMHVRISNRLFLNQSFRQTHPLIFI